MALFPDIAYPEPGWLAPRCVERQKELSAIWEVIDSTGRGVKLPVIQLVGSYGVGKSWILQILSQKLKQSVDIAYVLIRLSDPALADWVRMYDAVYSRLASKWKINLPLCEFLLGRISHLKGEQYKRYLVYNYSLRYLPQLSEREGEENIRRVLVEHCADSLRRIWGVGWGRRFLKMDPVELAWYLPDVFGMDIDQALRNSRMKIFVLMIDDAEILPNQYFSALRLKRFSNLTLPIIASPYPLLAPGENVRQIEVKPLGELEKRGYLYTLGIELREKQEKVSRKWGNKSIGYAWGAVKERKILEYNEGLKRLLGVLLTCHRPSVEVVYEITKDMGSISAFFGEPSLLDLLDHPDRIPRRFLIHPQVREWLLKEFSTLSVPENIPDFMEPASKLAVKAQQTPVEGIAELFRLHRDSQISGNSVQALDALFALRMVSTNLQIPAINRWCTYLLVNLSLPIHCLQCMKLYARHLISYARTSPENIPLLLAAGDCLTMAGHPRRALWISNSLFQKISAILMKESKSQAGTLLLRAEAYKIAGEAFTMLGDYAKAEAYFSDAVNSARKARDIDEGFAGESLNVLVEIEICRVELFASQHKIIPAAEIIANVCDLLESAVLSDKVSSVFSIELVRRLLDKVFVYRLWGVNTERILDIISKSLAIFASAPDDGLLPIWVEFRAEAYLWMAEILLSQNFPSRVLMVLDQLDEKLDWLGENCFWKADRWRMLRAKGWVIRSEALIMQGELEKAEKFASKAVELIKKWGYSGAKVDILMAYALTESGLVLARLEKFKQALDVLNEATSILEKVLAEPQYAGDEALALSLAGDCYHEMARILLHRKEIGKAHHMAERGLEHRTKLLAISSDPKTYFHLAKMFLIMLQTLPQENVDLLFANLQDAVNMALTGAKKYKDIQEVHSIIIEDIVRFGYELWRKTQNEIPARAILPLKQFIIRKEAAGKIDEISKWLKS